MSALEDFSTVNKSRLFTFEFRPFIFSDINLAIDNDKVDTRHCEVIVHNTLQSRAQRKKKLRGWT